MGLRTLGAFLAATIGLASLIPLAAALKKIDQLVDARRFDEAEPLARALVDEAKRAETDPDTRERC